MSVSLLCITREALTVKAGLNFPPVAESSCLYRLPPSSVLTSGSRRVWQRSSISWHTAVLICGIPTMLCLYNVGCHCQHTISGPGQERSPAVTQCLSTYTAYVTGRALCSIHMHILHVCCSNIVIFRYYFQLWRGLCLYMLQRLMNA